MFKEYTLIKKEKIWDSNQFFYIQSMIDDSGYYRRDFVVDEDWFEQRQMKWVQEPKGILVFLDSNNRIQPITAWYESAIQHYDSISSPIIDKPYIDLYHRLVYKNSLWRGSELLIVAIDWFQNNTNYQYITCKEVEQYSVLRRLLKNEFQSINYTRYELEELLITCTIREENNIYWYTENDVMIDKEWNKVVLSLYKNICVI
jgi:hypothetical protein